VDGRDEPGNDDSTGSAKKSERHFGKLRRAENPAIISDNMGAPGMLSRKFISHENRAA
jgi:hypothetical protein